jgi:hypothetical protein
VIDYTLAVLTHGQGIPLGHTLMSLLDKVRPKPTRTLVYRDGPVGRMPNVELPAEVDMSAEQRGFCRSTQHLWQWASRADTEFVFWLEHDFRFLRPVDLTDLAVPLLGDPMLAQMQLMRNAVSVEEIAAGGLYEMRRADYERVAAVVDTPGAFGSDSVRTWLRHRSYFTTNPSLMRTAWMAENPWPDDDEPHCEGRFSIDLVQRGFSYGVWGSGEAWVEHIGHRTGFGY